MSEISINIDTARFRPPTQEEVRAAKQFILRRNEKARALADTIDKILADAAQEIVTICYKYNVEPQRFFIGSEYNAAMMAEINEVMDELEAEIYDLIYNASLSVAKEDNRAWLAFWLSLLGRGNRNLRDTLKGYLYKTMKDWEAAIAALRYARVPLARAITKIRTHLHSIYTLAEVRAAFQHSTEFAATYIRSQGVMRGGMGLSNNGSTNVTNMAQTTLQMAWMHQQGSDFKEMGAIGYYQLRGSTYPCSLCDDETGFHQGMEDIFTRPYPHPHCCCYRVPIFSMEQK